MHQQKRLFRAVDQAWLRATAIGHDAPLPPKQTKEKAPEVASTSGASDRLNFKAFPAKVRSGFAQDNATGKEFISSKSAKRFCAGQCDRKRVHFQQKCEAVLRKTMRQEKSSFPAKARSGFAQDNATGKGFISSKSAKRFCAGQCDRKRVHFQQKREAVLRRTMRQEKGSFPAKARSGFAQDNATGKEFISSKSAKRFCAGQCDE